MLGLLLTACSSSDELRLTWDGESCTYEGPTDLNAGPVTLDFVNESEEEFRVYLMILDEGKTVQDVIDSIGPEPATGNPPEWTHSMDTWDSVWPSEPASWEGYLEEGIYAMVCEAHLPSTVDPFQPWGAWFGTGLTVEG